jgi:hypothetical protein
MTEGFEYDEAAITWEEANYRTPTAKAAGRSSVSDWHLTQRNPCSQSAVDRGSSRRNSCQLIEQGALRAWIQTR